MPSVSVGQPAGPERIVKNPRCSDFQLWLETIIKALDQCNVLHTPIGPYGGAVQLRPTSSDVGTESENATRVVFFVSVCDHGKAIKTSPFAQRHLFTPLALIGQHPVRLGRSKWEEKKK